MRLPVRRHQIVSFAAKELKARISASLAPNSAWVMGPRLELPLVIVADQAESVRS